MSPPVDLKKLIKSNPAVDEKQLEEVGSILKVLRKQGITGAKYNIVAPFTRRPAQASDKPDEDPRSIRFRT